MKTITIVGAFGSKQNPIKLNLVDRSVLKTNNESDGKALLSGLIDDLPGSTLDNFVVHYLELYGRDMVGTLFQRIEDVVIDRQDNPTIMDTV